MFFKKPGFIFGLTLLCSLVAVTSAEAVTITAISGNHSVTGDVSLLTGFSDSASSTATENILIQVSGGVGDTNRARSVIGADIINISIGGDPGPRRISVSALSTVRANGTDTVSSASFSYALDFSIDVAADFSLFNNTSGGFPQAKSDNGSADINISLKDIAGNPVFSYDAPTIGSPGTYAAGTIPAGDRKSVV